MAKGHPKVGWAPIDFAVATPWANLPHGIVSGIVLAWAPIGLAVMATLWPSQYYFGHTVRYSYKIVSWKCFFSACFKSERTECHDCAKNHIDWNNAQHRSVNGMYNSHLKIRGLKMPFLLEWHLLRCYVCFLGGAPVVQSGDFLGIAVKRSQSSFICWSFAGSEVLAFSSCLR